MKLADRIGVRTLGVLGVLGVAVIASAVLLTVRPRTAAADFFEVWVLDGVALISGLVCIAIARTRKERLPWLLAGLAFLSWSLANFYWAFQAVNGVELPVPSLADVGWLAFYPFAYASLLLLVRRRVARGGARWLDAVVASLSAAAVMGVLVLDPVVSAIDRKPSAAIGIYLFYGIGDLVLFGLAMGALVVSGSRGRPMWVVLTASYGLFTLADGFYLIRSAQETFEPGTLVSVGWPAAALLAAIAACLPQASAAEAHSTGWGRVAVPGAFGLVSVAVLLSATFTKPTPIGPLVAAASICAVLLRLVLVYRDNERMLQSSRDEALRDPLTGLGNRRLLHRDFHDLRADGTPLVFAVYDLDGFKEYNDTHGHAAGDEVLVRIGERLAAEVAGHGTAYRFGGDEFCVLIDANNRELADALPTLFELGPLTAACGTCQLPFEVTELDDATVLADRRMYERKSGRRSSDRSARVTDPMATLA